MESLQKAQENKRVWEELTKKYPELRHRPMPSIDTIVVAFLRKHEVFVNPVSSNINASSGMNAVMGAVGGPAAVGINQALTAQQKSAALQEWTSWKQWTLSHAEWPSFSSEYKQEYEEEITRATNRLGDPEVQMFLTSLMKAEVKRDKKVSVELIIGLVVTLSFFIAYVTKEQEKTPSDATGVEKTSSQTPEAVERCRLQAQKGGEEGGNPWFVGTRADTNKTAFLVFQKPDGTRWETSWGCE
jgi:hypothetical protein